MTDPSLHLNFLVQDFENGINIRIYRINEM
jgi:hypothetical protein